MWGALRTLIYFILAVLCGSLAGSVIQSQFNLAAISGLGAEIPLPVWFATTLEDIVGFAPLYAGMMAVSLLLGLLAAALCLRWLTPAQRATWQVPVYALAGALGIFVAFQAANAAAPMPTLIAATRCVPGTLAMMLSGALGGWIFARLHTLDQ